MNLNKVTLIGNLTGDPKTTVLPSGATVATFSVATNYRWRDYKTKELKESVEFHRIVAWRRIGEVVAKFLKKGDRVFLEGRLQTRSWKDKGNQKHSMTEIVADQLIMLGGKSRQTTASKPNDALLPEEESVETVVVS
ncbi:MAG: single-stranded DNA-binding protein [Candidatus Kerfeldbacteria bacterium]|nr:single-stranded DNA-binding protein [Candidatus Kerfeldbacteria bacterium]